MAEMRSTAKDVGPARLGAAGPTHGQSLDCAVADGPPIGQAAGSVGSRSPPRPMHRSSRPRLRVYCSLACCPAVNDSRLCSALLGKSNFLEAILARESDMRPGL